MRVRGALPAYQRVSRPAASCLCGQVLIRNQKTAHSGIHRPGPLLSARHIHITSHVTSLAAPSVWRVGLIPVLRGSLGMGSQDKSGDLKGAGIWRMGLQSVLRTVC